MTSKILKMSLDISLPALLLGWTLGGTYDDGYHHRLAHWQVDSPHDATLAAFVEERLELLVAKARRQRQLAALDQREAWRERTIDEAPVLPLLKTLTVKGSTPPVQETSTGLP